LRPSALAGCLDLGLASAKDVCSNVIQAISGCWQPPVLTAMGRCQCLLDRKLVLTATT
jgi:hypothetical protein